MTDSTTATLDSPAVHICGLQQVWSDLNDRYFDGLLPSIRIEWSSRLTASAGMFSTRMGPRSRTIHRPHDLSESRLIRLSRPLLQRMGDSDHAAVLCTLAHEMIHQWQFDILKRRPNHGADFCRQMHMMNRDGLGITIRHSYLEAVPSVVKYAWRCRRCGHAYERQRRTIRPGRHRCGTCRGPLYEIQPPTFVTAPPRVPARHEPSLLARVADLDRTARLNGSGQLKLTFMTD